MEITEINPETGNNTAIIVLQLLFTGNNRPKARTLSIRDETRVDYWQYMDF